MGAVDGTWEVGAVVGPLVGFGVVGLGVGESDKRANVGANEGDRVGWAEVGCFGGWTDGDMVGAEVVGGVGDWEGERVGWVDGIRVGWAVGVRVGLAVNVVGWLDVEEVGWTEGEEVGSLVSYTPSNSLPSSVEAEATWPRRLANNTNNTKASFRIWR